MSDQESRNLGSATHVNSGVHNLKLARVLARQDGVVSLKQALTCGISQNIVQRKVTSGEWRRCGPSVYRDRSHDWSAAAKLRAAVLGAGKDAAAHGLSAAWWHGLTEKAPPAQYVTIPKKRYLVRTADVHVRARDLTRRDLKVAGWRILRFDWHRLAHDAAGVAGEIRALLDRAR